MTGYKATDVNMQCRGFQFELNKWYEVNGDLIWCKWGFHFCVHPSGPWSYYTQEGTRVFRIEAEEVLETPYEAGSDLKKVCRRIRLVEEIAFSGDGNSGYGNSGDGNSGYGNSGDKNSGYGNSGYGNSGDKNSGDRNSGYGNSGDGNSGDGNSGYGNSGDKNSGYGNSGYGNSGDRNSGYGNSGDGNATNYSSNFFDIEEPKVKSFGKQTDLTAAEYRNKYSCYYNLCNALYKEDPINFEHYKILPGITKKKLLELHQKHLAAKKK